MMQGYYKKSISAHEKQSVLVSGTISPGRSKYLFGPYHQKNLAVLNFLYSQSTQGTHGIQSGWSWHKTYNTINSPWYQLIYK
jgi:hypothetical protein